MHRTSTIHRRGWLGAAAALGGARFSVVRGLGALGGLAALAALAAPNRAVATPAAATIPPPRDGSWHDAARSRELPWRLRLPAGAGPWPLVLFSHGLGGSRAGGDAWGEAWRAAGIAVLHLQHPGSDTETLRQGALALRRAASAKQLFERVADVHFVLDELARRRSAGEPPWAALASDAIGMAGHSFGARTTQAIAGERYPMPGNGGDTADARPRAFAAFSPSSPPRGSVAQAFGGITRPFLALTGSLDGDPFGSFAGGEPRARVYDGLPPGRRALLWLDGADHMTFAGHAEQPIRGGGIFRREAVAAEREAAHHALIARLTALWWRAQLQGDAEARAALAMPAAQAAQLGLGPNDRFVLG